MQSRHYNSLVCLPCTSVLPSLQIRFKSVPMIGRKWDLHRPCKGFAWDEELIEEATRKWFFLVRPKGRCQINTIDVRRESLFYRMDFTFLCSFIFNYKIYTKKFCGFKNYVYFCKRVFIHSMNKGAQEHIV